LICNLKEKELRSIAKKLPPILSAVITILLIITYANRCLLVLSEDVSPPEWRNQKQSALVIQQGVYICLQAEAMDAVSLHQAVLSTNETGVWRNETEYTELWKQEAVFGFDNFGTATYKDGVLYAPSKGNFPNPDNNVYAINASNGNIIWNRTVRQCDASPYIDDDVVYVGECSGPYGEPTPFAKAMALNRTTGEIVWQFIEPNNFTWVGSPVVNGEYVYYTTYDEKTGIQGSVYALNKTNGNPIWHQDIGAIVCSVAYDNGVVFVSVYNPPGQYAFNATSGAEVWHKNYGWSWDSSPIIYDGMVIQVAYNTTLKMYSTYVLNEISGELIRTFEGKGGCSTPLVHDGKIFIPNRAWRDWRIYAYNLMTGEELWHTIQLHNGYFQNQSYCSPTAAGGAIYYQSLNGTFYVINETDGNILWSFAMGGLGFGSPSIGDGCVFITNDFALYAFKIGPGTDDWPMFCQNNFHQSYSGHGIEYVRWPLTEPKDFKGSSNMWITARFVWCNKTITSAAVAWRIYFFDGAGNANATDIMVFYVNMLIHNIAIVDVIPEETVIQQNQTMAINVIAVNEGNYTETFNVTLYYDSTEIGFQSLTLNTSESRVLTFEWNTTGVPYGNYTISAHATIFSGEVDTQDNVYIVGYWVTVIPEFSFTTTLLAVFIISTLIVTLLVRKERPASYL
jgi:outer membrane protein assembly factor BamB